MIRVILGRKGSGKTKKLIDAANTLSEQSPGSVVFIDGSSQLMFDLKHTVRFINVSDFPIQNPSAFLGFICGVISGNYDLNAVIIDGLTYIVKEEAASLQQFFESMDRISERFNVDFHISINGDENAAPPFLENYIRKA